MNFDGDERDAGTDPENAGSLPGACNDGMDNDGDGQIDLADAGCGGDAGNNIENPQCSDGVDNDGDGSVDGADVHCSGPADNIEKNTSSCGIGFELALILPLVLAVRRRRGRGSVA